MQEISLPLVMVPTGLVAPSLFVDLPYAPGLLLDAHFPIAVVADEVFSQACRIGFDAYFEDLYEGSSSDEMHFVDRFYTTAQVKNEVGTEMLSPQAQQEQLPWRVGFVLGWLSALALAQPQEAQAGLHFLLSIVEREPYQVVHQREAVSGKCEYEVPRAVLASGSCGSDGWPLDM